MCKSLFNYTGNPVCPACNKILEEKFTTVKEYIRDNPTSTISKVAEATEVPVQQLKRWVREERLCFSKDSGVMIQCEKCGKPITTGRYCAECKHSMTQSFESLYNQNSPEVKKKSYGSAKMRFIDK
jgi:hypothetical protein